MRKLLKVLLSTIFLMGLAYSIAGNAMKDDPSEMGQAFNKFNIFAKEESKYVKIDNSNAHDEYGYGNYEYDLKSYDSAGQAHPLKFTGMGKLKQGRYLELDTKGTYVITYREVFEKDLPNGVYQKLNLQ